MAEHGPNGSDAPLFVWGEALRAARARRTTLRRRAAWLGVGIAALAATIAMPPRPRLVWNASASAPLGLYGITYNSTIRHGSTVLARLPAEMRALAAARHYLPSNVPLIKSVAALSGDEVCAVGDSVFIDGEPVVTRRSFDSARRMMPWWEGCHRLRDGELFLLMPGSAASFDGRYFGVTARADVIGKAHLIWRR
jgi:conjugative transfer signal peptidase TraF